MKITVKNYRGIAHADIELNPVALVCGVNGAGKSSIAQAVSAVLMGQPQLDWMKKRDARQLLRDGESRGHCTVDDGKISWPGGTVSDGGPYASAIATGTRSPVDMKPAECAAYLSDVLDASPDIGDLKNALPNASEQLLQTIWQQIEANGWDAAHKRATESGSRIKGEWQQITGENYGSKKAENWRPECFAAGLPDYSEVESAVNTARKNLETGIAQQATSAERIASLQQAIAAGETAAAELPALEQRLADTENKISAQRAELNASPRPADQEVTAKCPCCSSSVVVVSKTELRKPGAVDKMDNDLRRQAIAEHQEIIAALVSESQKTQSEIIRTQSVINSGLAAEQELQTTRSDGTTPDQIESLRERVQDAEYLLMMHNAATAAEKKINQLKQNAEIIEAMAPSGVRQTVLAEVLSDVNSELSKMCSISGWLPVRVTDDLAILAGDRDYRLLSESEKFRVRVILQLFIATRDTSSAVVIDAADILDRSGRNGLFALLRGYTLPALVCMTMNSREDMPDISRAGIGVSYWIENSAV